jgi:hypothetical protein
MKWKYHSSWIISNLMLTMIVGEVLAADNSSNQSFIASDNQASQATIPFANQGGISNWKVVDDSTLLIQDKHRHWYLAKLQTGAYDLAFAESIGFVTLPSGALGKFSAVVVNGRRYPIISLTRTEPPVR